MDTALAYYRRSIFQKSTALRLPVTRQSLTSLYQESASRNLSKQARDCDCEHIKSFVVTFRRVDLYPSRFQARVRRWVRVLFEGLDEIVTKDELKNSTHPNIVSLLLPGPAILSATDAKLIIMRMNATST